MPETLSDYYEKLLINYKSKGIVIDSNLLLYFFVGSYNNNLVSNFKVTKKFGIKGFDMLCYIINYFDKIITTPHILTEISNLSNKMDVRYKADYFNIFFQKLEKMDEIFFSAIENLSDENVRKFGLTDSAIVNLSKTKSYLILTEDFHLSNILSSRGIDVINFNHLLDIKFENLN
jgi:rRNA-processing protein FCF1